MSPTRPAARSIFLVHGEDPFRTRLRLAALVRDLLAGGEGAAGDLAALESPDLGVALGVSRHDAAAESPEAIALAGQSQGLFAPADERTVVLVDNAESLTREDGHVRLLAAFPPEPALVLVSLERLEGGRRGRAPRGRLPSRAPAARTPSPTLPDAVLDAGGRVERVERLAPADLEDWIRARAALKRMEIAPAAVAALASAVGPDSERVEQELAKLAAWAAGARVEEADVRQLVSGAIEADVFRLTEAVVRKDARGAMVALDRLLSDGQAVLQILALLLWQFRVLLFASALERTDPGRKQPTVEEMAKAIRSSPGAILRWRSEARRVSRSDVTAAYEAMYATDIAIKSGRVESEAVALTLCILDLCGVRGASVDELLATIPAPRR